MRIAALALGLVVVAGACATSGTAATDQTPTQSTTARRTNVITLEEIRESSAPSLADLVRQSRPSWPTQVIIMVNNDPFGDYNSLRNLSLNTTREIRYLSKSEAQSRFGSRIQDAVIQVVTR